MSRDKDKGYEVGYGKPPKSGQFKPGQSGNPKGKPKVQKNFKDYLVEAAQEMINVAGKDGSRKIIKEKALAILLLNSSLNNDHKSQKIVVPVLMNKTQQNDFEASPDDQEALKELKRRFIEEEQYE